jgi:hypothetical protein
LVKLNTDRTLEPLVKKAEKDRTIQRTSATRSEEKKQREKATEGNPEKKRFNRKPVSHRRPRITKRNSFKQTTSDFIALYPD